MSRGGAIRRSRRRAWALACAVAALGCSTERWVGPLEPTVLPLPAGEGADYVAGMEEVVAVRHSDPVLVRRAGATASFPLDTAHRRERLRSGGWVLTRAGGHAEVFWPLIGTSIHMSEAGALSIGEQARDEPAATFRQITRARCLLQPGVRVALPGGALLEGDPTRESGPFLLEARYPNVLRLSNDSKVTALVSFREEVLPIGPGQSVDLALLEVGTAPRESAPGMLRVEGDAFALALEGGATSTEAEGGFLVGAEADGRVRALGVEVDLDPTRRALFLPLRVDPPQLPAAGAPPPETAETGGM